MLAFDSLVLDLIFQANAELDPETLVEALGGQDVASARKILDPDMQDPRFELELSPSMPFRRRGERRLMIIDDSVAPMRQDPQDPIVPIDLRPERDRLIAACEAAPVRLGRLSALGSWGDAIMVARSARDLRAIALLSWVFDPMVDVDGTPRADRLGQKDIEAKILAYDQRLSELDDEQILKNLGPAKFERRGELLIVDCLEDDGTWDLRKSLMVENALAAIDRFSRIPGAPASPPPARRPAAGGAAPAAAGPAPARSAAEPAPPPAEPPRPEPAGPPLTAHELGDRIVLIFPPERFDLDVAAALGKKSWDTVLRRGDDFDGRTRDRIHAGGAGFVAPLEFLSEVFLDGIPLSRPAFDDKATTLPGGARALEVHCPRFGPVVLLAIEGKGRFITSELDRADDIAALL
jgi:hypothetical protein